MSEQLESLLNDFVDEAKKPSMDIIFQPNNDKENLQSLDSYIGGIPYFEKEEHWPICDFCKNQMSFLLQLNQKNGNKHCLKVFYHCQCQNKKYIPNVTIREYNEPSLKNGPPLNVLDSKKNGKIFEKFDVILDVFWSLPNWNLLPDLNPAFYSQMMTVFNNTKLAKNYYEDFRTLSNLSSLSDKNIYGGYPEFIADPKWLTCCNSRMEFLFQMDEQLKAGINFNGYLLFCFYCNKCKKYSFIYN